MATLALNLETSTSPAPRISMRSRLRLVTFQDRWRRKADQLCRGGSGPPEPIVLPANRFRTIIKMLIEVGNGNRFQVIHAGDATTQHAADLLNVLAART